MPPPQVPPLELPTPQQVVTPMQIPSVLPIDQLDPHPLNSNVMPKALFDKLAREIDRTGLYPPVIVRPIGDRYQILDGHHRVRVLQQLGRVEASVVIWPIDDEQALVLLASLNRLQGEDDPRKRGALLDQLRQSMTIRELSHRLPEDAVRVKKLLELNAAPPSPCAPRPVDQMPVCVHFFVQPAERSAIERKLRDQGGSRESALLALLNLPLGDDR
ncbi:MAG: ParB/RepB/Spo0J family partition protein [Phycisphaeraceae bacterium]